MTDFASWVISNVREARTGGRLEQGIPFAIWQRQWEVCDVTADRKGSGKLVQSIQSLAETDRIYSSQASYYLSALAIYRASYQEALEFSRKGLEQAVESGDREGTARMYDQMGEASYYLSDYPSATEYRLKALDIFNELGQALKAADVNSDLGLTCWRTGSYAQALEYSRQAQVIYEKENNVRQLIAVKTNVASIYIRMDKIDEAFDLYQQVFGLAQAIGDKQKQSSLLNNIGVILLRRGKYQEALSYLQRGVELDRAIGNITGEAAKLNNMAVLEGTLGDQDRGLRYLERALKIDISTGNLNGQVSKLNNMADLWALKQDYTKALECSLKTVELSRQIKSKDYLCHSLVKNVELSLLLGRLDQAVEYGREGLALAVEIGSFSAQMLGYTNLANVCLNQGDIQKAMEYSDRALEINKKHNVFEAALEKFFYQRHKILAAAGQNEQSRECLETAYRELVKKAEGIQDPEGKIKFFNSTEDNRNIIKDWEKIKDCL
jgi:tetratricopeptide (TPR) repeat protein